MEIDEAVQIGIEVATTQAEEGEGRWKDTEAQRKSPTVSSTQRTKEEDTGDSVDSMVREVISSRVEAETSAPRSQTKPRGSFWADVADDEEDENGWDYSPRIPTERTSCDSGLIGDEIPLPVQPLVALEVGSPVSLTAVQVLRVEHQAEDEGTFEETLGDQSQDENMENMVAAEVSTEGRNEDELRRVNFEEIKREEETSENQSANANLMTAMEVTQENVGESLVRINNPFKTHFSLVIPNETSLTIGHEVSFEGRGQTAVSEGRGPKKKDLVASRSGAGGHRSRKKWNDWESPESSGEVPLQSKSAAEKRRALGELDRNGCRLSERRDAELEMLDDSFRERKLRSDGLQQVEIPDDARGKSTVLRGSEERLWKSLALEKGLVDGYFCAATTEGSRFTRIAKKRSRLNFSRLDRVYLTGGELVSVRDSRRRWSRGWHRVCHVLKDERDARRARRNNEGDLAREIAWRKEHISADPDPAEVEALSRAETKLTEQQLKEARCWRLRSRIRWLSMDDVPARYYFFAKLKSKWARETISALERTDGEVTSDKDEILEEIHSFYSYCSRLKSYPRKGRLPIKKFWVCSPRESLLLTAKRCPYLLTKRKLRKLFSP
ncbi:hypothetical protein R1sor_010919 [Riccia sorocarpa]|uniref:Uncharacterized protein n=1 Tax=Riccia sorocarpa TaxID=122646 RepID=A0ABD3HZF6_9MARC